MNDAAQETASVVNKALSIRGAPYNHYSSKLVSWDDVSRGTEGSVLSIWGANITDTYLKTKDGTSLFTIRPDNWNEKLGVVRTCDIALLTGNCDTGAERPALQAITLEQFLARPAQYGAAYTGIASDVSLSCAERDAKVSIRFQTVFLPLPTDGKTPNRVQFAAESYNYISCNEDPRNLILLASSQGIALQADGDGAKRLLHHGRDTRTGPAKQFWLEAEATRHSVGFAQVESADERARALSRGKATSETVGIRAMGTRFNALMTLQIPLRKQLSERTMSEAYGSDGSDDSNESIDFCLTDEEDEPREQLCVKSARCHSGYGSGGGRGGRGGRGCGSAARVSRGDFAGYVPQLVHKKPTRHEGEHVTATVVLYHCVQDGVPGKADVFAAIDELERFYAACTESGRLADAKFEFMTKPLAVQDVVDIYEKIMS